MEPRAFICQTCGKEVDNIQDKAPCEVLQGWLMVTNWKGHENVDQIVFCSYSCLKRWVDSKTPNIPDIFMKSFEDDDYKNK
ncbi:MAG: hypothetical protein NTV30_01375 [Chloroflexi bacterium]|nr:hypothetical protein [Chloroflexota bacterium]